MIPFPSLFLLSSSSSRSLLRSSGTARSRLKLSSLSSLSTSVTFQLQQQRQHQHHQQQRQQAATILLLSTRQSSSLTKANNNNHDSVAVERETSLSSSSEISTPPMIPIDFDVASKIEGNESQILTVQLEPGQVLRAESGAMMYMTDGVEMNTSTGAGGTGAGAGISAGFRRLLTGQNFFISDYTYHGAAGTHGVVALGTDFPSKILRLNVDDYGGKIVCQKGALLCASPTIDVQMEFTQNLKTGFFGGEGFVLQALTGSGEVFVKAGGTLIRRDLKEGEQLRVASGCLVAFVDAQYDVQMVKGFANVFAGGEGLFMTTFTGPGVVWLQGQPPQRMISEIARRVPSGGGIGFGIPIGGGGGGSGGGSGEGGAGAGETPGN